MDKKKFLIILSILVIILCTIGVIAEDLVIDSKTQTFSETDNKIKFDGGVNVKYGDIQCVGDNADITVDKNNRLDTATIYNKPYAFQIKNNKKREVKANILKFSLLNKVIKAEGDTQSIITEGKTPVAVINADAQEYDLKTNVMTATGGVAIKYKDLRAFADKAVINTGNHGELKRIDLIGRAKIDQAKHHLIADHFIYSADQKQMTAIGNATTTTVLDNGKEFILKANYQNYSQLDGVFVGNGSVKAWYDDYFARGPKVVAYPDKSTNKINEVFLMGRSTIRQNEKEITADKIKVIIDPKNFMAEGNVRTVIHQAGVTTKKVGF
jgi:lipopolysaccharide export system protein LptA